MANTAKHLSKAARIAALAVAANMACAGSAWAYVGASFLKIPGLNGGWKGATYTNWVKADGNYWDGKVDTFGSLRKGMYFFSGPQGPKAGAAGKLVLAFDKGNPILAKLMTRCKSGEKMPELTFAEKADWARRPQEVGPRPADIPEYFEYKLGDAQIVDCPVVAAAPQQAIVIAFRSGERLNYAGDGETVAYPAATPAQLMPVSATRPGRSKSFVLTWFAFAGDVADDQCPVMNTKPTEDQYYALMSKEDADKERAENARHGGVNYENGQFGLRGPHKLDAMRMPGIVPDPGNAAPQTKVARGFNLDGSDGSGKKPGTRAHLKYVSPDGRTGIDNQLYTAQGCIPSFMGHKGFIMQFSNNQMHDGMLSMIVEIAGIDDDRNDDDVEISLTYSLDPMAKSGSGKDILSDYTFRLTDKPQFTYYEQHLHGRIVDGVITIDPVKSLTLNLGQYGTPNELTLVNPQMRLEITPDGNLKGVLGGYQDWRTLVSRYITSTVENIHNMQVPGLYNALRRDADGMKNPLTGEYEGISSAYDIEGVPIFVALPTPQVAQAGAGSAKASPR